MSLKKRFEMEVSQKEVSQFLKDLAEAIEKGKESMDNYPVDLVGFKNVKISLKPLYGGLKLRLKVKQTEMDIDDEEYQAVVDKEKYKHLKKRMETYFEEIKEAAQENNLPSKEIISVFIKDAQNMCNYPGISEASQEQFKNKCMELQQAFEQEDQKLFREKSKEISLLKDNCHAKYK